MTYRDIICVGLLALAGCSSTPPAQDPARGQRVERLRPGLTHADPATRRAATRALAREGAEAGPVLATALQGETDASVRHELVAGLGRTPDPGAAARLVRLARDPAADLGERLAAVTALAGQEAAGTTAALTTLADAADAVGRAARLALTARPDAEARGWFRRAAGQASLPLATRREVVAGLTRLAEAADGPLLARLAADADPAVRRAATAALGRVGGPEAQDVLARALLDADAGVRKVAAAAAWRAGRP